LLFFVLCISRQSYHFLLTQIKILYSHQITLFHLSFFRVSCDLLVLLSLFLLTSVVNGRVVKFVGFWPQF
jgi:hypothetical protein